MSPARRRQASRHCLQTDAANAAAAQREPRKDGGQHVVRPRCAGARVAAMLCGSVADRAKQAGGVGQKRAAKSRMQTTCREDEIASHASRLEGRLDAS